MKFIYKKPFTGNTYTFIYMIRMREKQDSCYWKFKRIEKCNSLQDYS